MSINPYEPPRYSLPERPSAEAWGEMVYYRTDPRYLTIGEFWRLSTGVVEFVLMVFVSRILRLRLPVTFAFAAAPFSRQIDRQEIPERVWRELQPAVEQAAAGGLEFCFAYVLPSLGNVEGWSLAYRSPDGATIAPIVYVRVTTGDREKLQVSYTCLSQLADGRMLATSGNRRMLQAPPEYCSEFYPGRGLNEVYVIHQRRLSAETSPARLVANSAETFAAIRGIEHRGLEFQCQRRVYVEASPRELDSLLRRSAEAPLVPRPRPAYQGWEVVFLWIGLAAAYFLLQGAREVSVRMLIGWGAVLACCVSGLLVIWGYRFYLYRQRRSHSSSAPQQNS
ncbi:MAG: hypothetical protein U0935_15215 [Pirellulales bacterium]